MSVFFTSDLHFNHKNIIDYDERPYKNVEEMEVGLIKNWNNTVGRKDKVYIIGDFAMGNTYHWRSIIHQLQGDLVLVRGNHDVDSKATMARLIDDGVPMFQDVADILFKRMDGIDLTLCHYPYSTYEGEDRYLARRPANTGRWLLHGHTHKGPIVQKNMINVGCMLWNYRPVAWEKLRMIIQGEL